MVKTSLQLNIGHHLTMTPQLHQAIRLLQLSAVELQHEIQQALETNTMLEQIDAGELELGDTASTQEHNDSLEDEDSTANNSDNLEWEQKLSSHSKEAKQQSSVDFLSLNTAPTSLKDHLFWQMNLTPFSELDKIIATVLIDSIDDNGFLQCALEDIHQFFLKELMDIDLDEVETVLHRIQQFDPPGIGARNIKECLILQLNSHLSNPTVAAKARILIESYLPLLAKHNLAALKRKLQVSPQELEHVIHCILSLNPKPGSKLSHRTVESIIPDVIAYKHPQKGWQVELNPQLTPDLQINHHYASLIRKADTSRDNEFLKNQLHEARWFIKSVENRNETLLKVTRAIVNYQQPFLDKGDEAMKPLILNNIAKALDIHESTVSRITTNKFIHTPRGTFELKYFFPCHLRGEQGSEYSATAIRAMIKKLIDEENPKKPLSDNTLTQYLQEKGIAIARRTVAKYRETMTIPPSNERKQIL